MDRPLRFRLFLAIVVSLLASLGCQRGNQAPSPAAPPTVDVVVAVPINKRTVEWDEYTGRLDAIDFVEVRSRVGGYLESIHFVEGQMVKQGDLLFVVDPRPYVAAVKQADAAVRETQARENESKAALVLATTEQKESATQLVLEERRYRRGEQLLPSNSISKDELELLQSDLVKAQARVESANANVVSAEAAIAAAGAAIATAQAALEAARLNLDYTNIRAPIAGRASRHMVTEGNLISGGTADSTLLTTIVSIDPIHCYFDADEMAFLKYARLAADGTRASSRDVKNPVYLGLADEKPKFPHQGHMDFVDNRLDPNTGTMRGRAILRNPDQLLTPGLFARIRLPGSGAYDAILIPDLAIQSDQAERFVYVVGDDGTVNRQVVKLGPLSHGLHVVREGLKGNEKIIISGMQRLRPGTKVKATVEELKLNDIEGLPDEYQPVPESEWITRNSSSAPQNGNLEKRPAQIPTPLTPERGVSPAPAKSSP